MRQNGAVENGDRNEETTWDGDRNSLIKYYENTICNKPVTLGFLIWLSVYFDVCKCFAYMFVYCVCAWLFIYFDVFKCFAYMFICVPCVCLVPVEVRAMNSWNLSSRQLSAVMWALGVEPGSSKGC